MKKILIVDDDRFNAQIISHYLVSSGEFTAVWAKDAREALTLCHQDVDLILLDIMLPDVNGVDLCREMRKIVYCPIIFISCVDDEDVMIRALETGGDDYLVKPFSNKILLARIQANLRRISSEGKARVLTGGKVFSVNAEEHTITARGVTAHLSSIEYGILVYMMSNPRRSISSDELYEAVWGAPSHGDVRTVVSHVYNLRKKIEKNPQQPEIIKSVRGYGYYFNPDED